MLELCSLFGGKYLTLHECARSFPIYNILYKYEESLCYELGTIFHNLLNGIEQLKNYRIFRSSHGMKILSCYLLLHVHMLTLCLQSQQPLSPPMMVPSQLSPGPNQQVQGTK